MNVSENKQTNKEQTKNYHFEDKIERIIQNDIKISNQINHRLNQQNQVLLKQKDILINELKSDNQKLKKLNKELVVQLQRFSKKLDEELKKRSQSHQKKFKPSLKPQQKESIEIQNLYKKIEIYKKQNALLKSKISNENEMKLNDSENKLKVFMKENEELKIEIKSLKKIIKQQQKGLSDIGAEGFLKVTSENDKMKNEIMKLRMQIDQVQRKYRTNNSLLMDKIVHTSQGQSQQAYQHLRLRKQHTLNQKSFQYRKKNLSQYRAKTQISSLQKDSTGEQNQSQLNLNKQTSKLEKYESKIRSLNTQKMRQKEIIQNLKVQIIQKDKEINYLREKIDFFRKTPKIKRVQQSQNNRSIHEQQDKKPFFMTQQSSTSGQQRQKYKKVQQQFAQIHEQILKRGKISRENDQNTTVLKNRYPRIEDRGLKSDFGYKWNHHQFSSKIKQIQVYTYPSGHIQHIHVRYQKGEPQKPAQLNLKKFSELICQEQQQFVTQIKGGFKSKYLQYVVFKTNEKRVAQFGNIELENECQNFSFSIQSYEYPCALFGQYESQGITRLGCFIDKL